MARKNRDSNKKTWSMYPSLHHEVTSLLLQQDEEIFYSFEGEDDDDDSKDCENEYDTTVMGRFICRSDRCKAAPVWTSGHVAITIREYSGNRYNARVYYQSCKKCGRPSKPRLDHSYAERVAYRLKKWSGVPVEPPPFSGRSEGPHRSDLCEGCRQGHCSRMGSGL